MAQHVTGAANRNGLRYEDAWLVRLAAKVLAGEADCLEVEWFDHIDGIEAKLVRSGQPDVWLQAKSRSVDSSWTIASLAKSSTRSDLSPRPSILQDMLTAHDCGATFWFCSDHIAKSLERLTRVAATPGITFNEFTEAVTKDRSDFATVESHLRLSGERVFGLLRSTEVRTASFDVVRDLVRALLATHLEISSPDADHCAARLAQGLSVGRFDRAELLRIAKAEPRQPVSSVFADMSAQTARWVSTIENRLPTDSVVGREIEVAELTQVVRNNMLTLVPGPGGVGKSAVLMEVARRLTGEGSVVAALAASDFSDVHPGLAFGTNIAGDLAVVLASCPSADDCRVLIIDQVDELAFVSGTQRASLNAFVTLARRAIELGVKVVIGCRSFDLEAGEVLADLERLTPNATRYEVGLLRTDAVRSLLPGATDDFLEICRLPMALKLALRLGVIEDPPRTLSALVARHRDALRRATPAEVQSRWRDVESILTEVYLADSERSVPRSRLDSMWPQAEVMVSNGVLEALGPNRVRFFSDAYGDVVAALHLLDSPLADVAAKLNTNPLVGRRLLPHVLHAASDREQLPSMLRLVLGRETRPLIRQAAHLWMAQTATVDMTVWSAFKAEIESDEPWVRRSAGYRLANSRSMMIASIENRLIDHCVVNDAIVGYLLRGNRRVEDHAQAAEHLRAVLEGARGTQACDYNAVAVYFHRHQPLPDAIVGAWCGMIENGLYLWFDDKFGISARCPLEAVGLAASQPTDVARALASWATWLVELSDDELTHALSGPHLSQELELAEYLAAKATDVVELCGAPLLELLDRFVAAEPIPDSMQINVLRDDLGTPTYFSSIPHYLLWLMRYLGDRLDGSDAFTRWAAIVGARQSDARKCLLASLMTGGQTPIPTAVSWVDNAVAADGVDGVPSYLTASAVARLVARLDALQQLDPLRRESCRLWFSNHGWSHLFELATSDEVDLPGPWSEMTVRSTSVIEDADAETSDSDWIKLATDATFVPRNPISLALLARDDPQRFLALACDDRVMSPAFVACALAGLATDPTDSRIERAVQLTQRHPKGVVTARLVDVLLGVSQGKPLPKSAMNFLVEAIHLTEIEGLGTVHISAPGEPEPRLPAAYHDIWNRTYTKAVIALGNAAGHSKLDSEWGLAHLRSLSTSTDPVLLAAVVEACVRTAQQSPDRSVAVFELTAAGLTDDLLGTPTVERFVWWAERLGFPIQDPLIQRMCESLNERCAAVGRCLSIGRSLRDDGVNPGLGRSVGPYVAEQLAGVLVGHTGCGHRDNAIEWLLDMARHADAEARKRIARKVLHARILDERILDLIDLPGAIESGADALELLTAMHETFPSRVMDIAEKVLNGEAAGYVGVAVFAPLARAIAVASVDSRGRTFEFLDALVVAEPIGASSAFDEAERLDTAGPLEIGQWDSARW